MTENKGRKDRRAHLRSRGSGEVVKFRRLNPLPSGEPDVYHQGNLVDLSKGGIFVQTTHAITRGERIEYFVTSADGKGNREGTARIVRVNRDPDHFFVAVEFRR